MFDDSDLRRTGLPEDVPEWAFSGALRREAAAERAAGWEVGDLGPRLAALPGGPRLVALIESVLTPGLSDVGPVEGDILVRPDPPPLPSRRRKPRCPRSTLR